MIFICFGKKNRKREEQKCCEKMRNITSAILIILLLAWLLYKADKTFLCSLLYGFPVAFVFGAIIHCLSFDCENLKNHKAYCISKVAMGFSVISSALLLLVTINYNKRILNYMCAVLCVCSIIYYLLLWCSTLNPCKSKEKFYDYFPIISNEYILSDLTKGGSVGKERSEIIKNTNFYNLFFSFVLFIIVIIVDVLPKLDSVCIFGLTGKRIIEGIVIARLITRSFEVSVAFFNDVIVISDEPKSDLNAGERIILAVLSLLELVLSYAVYYYLCGFGKLEAITRSFGNSTLTDVSFFNAAGEILPPSFCFVVAMQVITSFVLISFSIASYLNNIKSEEKEKNK